MKSILFFVGSFFAIISSAHAESSLRIPQGLYKPSGLQVLTVKHYERVYTGPVSGKERLRQLRADGYACVAQDASLFLCSKFDKDLSLPQSLQESIQQSVTNYTVYFQEIVAAPYLENEGDSYQEWSVSQKISVGDDTTYKSYRYQVSPGLHKIVPKVNDSLVSMNWVVDSVSQIREPRGYEIRESSNKWSSYFVAIQLSR